jgi:FlaA1/EpsC-like NDP-sugar epimerase
MPQNLLIIGATGVIGKPITRAIVDAKDAFGRIAVLTSENTIQNKESEIKELEKSGVEVLIGDITKEEDVKKAYNGPPQIGKLPKRVADSSQASILSSPALVALS